MVQSRVNVDYHEKQSVSDIFTLTDVVTNKSLALIPSDSEGNFNWRGITKAPLTRNAMQTTQSSGEWSDMEYPWMAIQQEDWTGGRANLRFTTDKSRFYDSRRAQTAFNACIYNAPLDHYSTGFKDAYTNHPDSLQWVRLRGDTKYLICEVAINGTYECGCVYIHLRRRGRPESDLRVRLLSDTTTTPTVYAEHLYTLEEVTDITAEFYKFEFESVELSSSAYIEVSAEEYNEDDYWEVGCTNNSNLTTYNSADGENWQLYNKDLLYRIDRVPVDEQVKFFTYEQLTFMVRQNPIANRYNDYVPSLWINGDIGALTDRTANTLTDNSKEWVVNCFAGARIGLVYREGSEEHLSVWRKIVSNTADTITIEGEWDLYPSTSDETEYVIVDTPLWREITGHGLTSYVTDIHVIRGVVYFCQGDHVAVRKMRWNHNAFEFMELTGIYATFLQSVRDRNGLMLYRARNDDENHKRSVERSILLDWETTPTEVMNRTSAVETSDGTKYSTAVDFGAGDYDQKLYKVEIGTFSSDKNSGKVVITLQESEDNSAFTDVQSVTATSTGIWYINAHCQYRYRRIAVTASGTNCSVNNIKVTTTQIPRFVDRVTLIDNYGKIVRLFEYGAEQEKSLWIFQEGMVSSINKTENTTDTYNHDRINIDELWTTADEHNAKAVGTTDVYLLWSWLNGLQRYYNTQLEGKGTDHDEGMPEDMRGRVTQILSYPSNFFISIDGGENGYSSIMMFNGNGWHNLYRAPNKGERIFDIAFQPIYGDRPDRLWAQVGDNVIWLAMPSKILYALQDPNAEYTHESIVVSSWITGGMAEVDKLWQSLSIMADYLDGVNCWIEADYQLDDEETWHPIPTNPYDTSPQQEENFAADNESINGKKLRYRLRLQTTDYHKTPKVNVVLIKAVGRVDIKYSYSFAFRNIKYKADLTGEYEELEPYDLDEILSDWANRLVTLRMNSAYKIFDNKRVFLDALQTSVVYEKGEGYLSQITLTEI